MMRIVRALRTPPFILLALSAFSVAGAAGQENGAVVSEATKPEFELQVVRNLVLVHVVVRDAQGQPVRNLTQNDFEVFDNGKRQVITQFSVEGETPVQPAAGGSVSQPALGRPVAEPAAKETAQIPDNFVAFYFDDLSMKPDDVMRTRAAAERYLTSTLGRDARVGIFTSSGKGNQVFTLDRDKLHAALLRLQPQGGLHQPAVNCPDLSDYEAYLIVVLRDDEALEIATMKVIYCRCGGNARACHDPRHMAWKAAEERWEMAEEHVIHALRGLGDIVRFMTVLPGRRSIVFVSSGFISQTQTQRISEIIDRAIRAGVVVNAIDPRGLYATVVGGDLGERLRSLGALHNKYMQIGVDAPKRISDVLWEMADGTGGVFFHDNNDLDLAFRQAGGLTRFSYLLAFSPNNPKGDGKYHRLKVKLARGVPARGLTIQARHGYFLPRAGPQTAEQSREALADLVFSRHQTSALPVSITTRMSPLNEGKREFWVEARLDARSLHFERQEELNVGDVTFAAAVFDDSGNYVDGIQKDFQVRVDDTNLQRLFEQGLFVQMDFQLAPGAYLLRHVVRESGGAITTRNLNVRVP